MSKADFVEELKNFYMNVIGNPEGIEDLRYIEFPQIDREYVYVLWRSGAQQRFSVWGDNEQGITKDFFRFLDNHDHYGWLKPEERI